ncbi:MAG: hypothetical protein HOI19_15870 [Rhodospirillaceae bacterium]|nr:hypothetical protein [Rhodospirillaceae bacterium]
MVAAFASDTACHSTTMAAAGKAIRAFKFNMLNLPFNLPATKPYGEAKFFTQMSDKFQEN